MPNWFDIKSLDFDEYTIGTLDKMIDVQQLEDSLVIINQVIKQEIKLLDGQSEKVIIGGFDQGNYYSLFACEKMRYLNLLLTGACLAL